MSVYMDSCCFIDVAKYNLGHKADIDHLADKEEHIKACIRMLDAARDGNLRVLTGNITISECQHLSGIIDEDIKKLFRSVLSSGRVARIVADSIFIAERARDLMWDYNIRMSGADAHHVATALESKCDEFITSDNGILKWATEIGKLGLKVIRADESTQLAALHLARIPQVSNQGSLLDDVPNLLDFTESDEPKS
ncbi:MAG TPA: PIN domain-containing protein [Pyrinomonadaceae bacterium]|jgi:predicted nucleic acid-binding protein|nr:PIN domain-containing protein [Pyrinomonadaceae bacterium]